MRTPRETYFLLVIGALVAVLGLVLLGFLGITMSYVITLLGPSEAEVDWADVAGGLLMCSIGAAAVVLLIKLYRIVERRGVLDPPHRP